MINGEYTYGHLQKPQTGIVVVDLTWIDLWNTVIRLLQIMIQTSQNLMKLPENYFRQKKYVLVTTYLSRLWSYFPNTMDLQFASRKRL
jgi:hypothetical protein